MARGINMTASYYVTGNIDQKKRTRWVEAIPDAPDVKKLDDIELGKMVKAGNRVLRHAKFCLNKLNQQGGRNSWTKHMSDEKDKIIAQIDAINPFLDLAEAEADRRENEPLPAVAVVTTPQFEEAEVCPHCGSRNIDKLDDDVYECYDCGKLSEESEAEIIDVPAQAAPVQAPVEHPSLTPDLCGMFMDTNLAEILEFAKQGLEGNTKPAEVDRLKAELAAADKANAEHEVRIAALEENIEGLKKSYDELKERNTALYAESKELKAENKKLRNAANEIKNMAARLKDLA